LVGLTCISDTTDLCANVSCDEWKQCNYSNGACVLKSGRCDINSDCSNGYTCDSSNTCFNSSNPCEGQTCSSHGVCVNTNGVPICSCDGGYMVANQGKECKNICGDNVIVEVEDCEGSLNGQTCKTLGYSAGNLLCESCLFNKTDCRLTKQWGSTGSDTGYSVAVDNSGNVFVTGITHWEFDGNTNSGEWDIFLTKFDNAGNKLWTKQWGTTQHEEGNSVAVDSSGNIFITGFTYGELDGNTNAGEYDIFLTKFDNNGNKLWTKQWGTTSYDKGNSVAVDTSGNVFVTGNTEDGLDGNTSAGSGDIFLIKFDNNGNKLWTKQWGTTEYDKGNSVAIDSSGNVFVTGHTSSGLDGNTNAGSSDIFLTKFDNAGNKLFTKQWGTTEYDYGNSVAVDSSGNVFVTGHTGGGLDGNTNAGNYDIFLTKFDNNGNKLWTKQLGTTSDDRGYSVAVDSLGNVFVTGLAGDGLDGNTAIGGGDIFLTKFDNAGNKLWTKQWGSYGNSVAVDGSGNVFVTGNTQDALDGNTSAGGLDIFLTKFEGE